MSMSGHGMFLCGQKFFARFHIRCVLFSLQCVIMWFIDSVLLQVAHCSHSSYLFMFLQYFPIRWVPCIVL